MSQASGVKKPCPTIGQTSSVPPSSSTSRSQPSPLDPDLPEIVGWTCSYLLFSLFPDEKGGRLYAALVFCPAPRARCALGQTRKRTRPALIRNELADRLLQTFVCE